MSVSSEPTESLSIKQWQAAADRHQRMMRPWTNAFRQRRRSGQSHPIHDFLFIYYQYSPAKLEQWHPGVDVRLAVDSSRPDYWPSRYYRICPGSESELICDRRLIDSRTRQRMHWIVRLLNATSNQKPNFSCLGLHEWAMVYQGQEIRHEKTLALRLPQAEIDRLVETRPVTCTHFDAFRFFAINAQPLNRHQPTLESRPELEQPACIHANMDLYKWAYKCMPWIGSDLLRDCFWLALEARGIDMRASPYDLSDYPEYPVIRIETAAGRAEYEQAQREIFQRAQPLRRKLADRIASVLRESHV